MNTPGFSPFIRFAKPFVVGLQSLEERKVFHFDADAGDYLQQKLTLWENQPESIFKALPDTIKAQNEVLDFVAANLAEHHSGRISRTDHGINISGVGAEFLHSDFANTPLMLASLLVQDDLVLMRKQENGWVLAAGSVCFPSSWQLVEKFTHSLERIHRPVPGLNQRIGPMIRRIFDNLKPQLPVWRENWSLDGDDQLRQAQSENARGHKFDANYDISKLYIRGEYQTLHKLPVNGDILFTINVLIERLESLQHWQNGAKIATQLSQHVSHMSEAELDYKRFTAIKPRLIKYLDEIVADNNDVPAHTTI